MSLRHFIKLKNITFLREISQIQRTEKFPEKKPWNIFTWLPHTKSFRNIPQVVQKINFSIKITNLTKSVLKGIFHQQNSNCVFFVQEGIISNIVTWHIGQKKHFTLTIPFSDEERKPLKTHRKETCIKIKMDSLYFYFHTSLWFLFGAFIKPFEATQKCSTEF